MTGQTISIGMLWHSFNSGNHGVNALTVSNTAIARAAAESIGVTPRFVYFAPGTSPTPQATPTGDTVIGINRRTVLTSGIFWRALGTLDCMLDISAGDSFADIYSAQRFGWMWLTKRMTIARGVPLVLSPQTIGPFTRQPYKQLAAGIMRKAHLTIARDPLSLAAIEALAPGAPHMLAADVAFRLPFTRRPHAKDGKIHVGINVSGLLWRQSANGANTYGLSYDYAPMMRGLLDALMARPDVVVHLITHVVDKAMADDSDGAIADVLAAQYPKAIRVADFAGPSDAKTYISGLDMMVAARMHACIAAFSSGVPVVPIAYSRKFMGLFGDLLDYGHTLPPTGNTMAEAIAFVLDRLERRHELANAVAAGNARVLPLLNHYDVALKTLFSQTKSRHA
ncbi:MAG: polysaccharide pyruvyl transferase family protein [Sphingomonas sp.]